MPRTLEEFGVEVLDDSVENGEFMAAIPVVWSLSDMEQPDWEEIKQGLIVSVARAYKEAIEAVEQQVERRMNES